MLLAAAARFPLLPNYVLHKDGEKIVLRNYKHKIYSYKNYHDKNNPEKVNLKPVEVKNGKQKIKAIKATKVKLPRMVKIKV
jgi:hypothetical protein